MVFEVGAPPAKIDPEILSKMRKAEIGYFAPNPRKTLRNQAQDTRKKSDSELSLAAPKFLSEKAREAIRVQQSEQNADEAADVFDLSVVDSSLKRDVPIMYRNVEIRYSKFGVDDFDFK
jgi:PAB-dependent poly(A)-specific ribonuclease subunit 2